MQKFLSECGIASRRKAEELIVAGKVKVNGKVAELGQKIDPAKDRITVKGKPVVAPGEKIYVMLYKPRGYVTTLNDELDRKCVAELVGDIKQRIYPVGRLDKDSEGLLIMTNDGEFANMLTHPSHHLPKTYRVTVKEQVTEEQINMLTAGLMLDGRKTLPCDVDVITREPDRTVLKIVLYEGRNRQIRRMCEQVGLTVKRLKRTEIAGVKLGMLRPGRWRYLTKAEVAQLYKAGKSNKLVGEQDDTNIPSKRKRRG